MTIITLGILLFLFHSHPSQSYLGLANTKTNSVQIRSSSIFDQAKPKCEVCTGQKSMRRQLRMSSGSANSRGVQTSQRIQKIRDITLNREIVDDLTACEFALKVEVKSKTANIDYETLAWRLDKDISLLKKRKVQERTSETEQLILRLEATKKELVQKIESAQQRIEISDAEPSSIEYTDRMEKIGDSTMMNMTTNNGLSEGNTRISETDSSININTNNESNSGSSGVIPSLRVVVREDGTVDWDEAIASTKEVVQFGTELWERLNGKQVEEGLPSISEIFGQVTVKVPETEQTKKLSSLADVARRELAEVVKERDAVKEQLKIKRKNKIEISSPDLLTLRNLDGQVKEREIKWKLLSLDSDMELICSFLEQELQASVTPADQRLILAEVALIDRQLSSLIEGVGNSASFSSVSEAGLSDANEEDNLSSLVDENELALIASEVSDLKSRLSIESGPKAGFDWGTLGVFVSDNLKKVKEGLSFYTEGTKMLLSDVQYVWVLVLKAATGYTLRPREVNSMRRTGKDILTLIPFTIILIIPLSPIGHVLVFSFIQKYFPDFFPSCYTEKRQNLRRLYSIIERKSDDDGEEPGYNLYKSFDGGSKKDGAPYVWVSVEPSVGSSSSPVDTIKKELSVKGLALTDFVKKAFGVETQSIES